MKDDFETTKGSQEALDLAAPPPPPLLPQPRSPAYGADADAGDGIHLRDYWRAVYKRLWLVVGVVIFVTLAAALYMARQPDVYVSQARVRVNIESAGPGLARNNQYVIINNPVSDPTYFNTQLQILTSPGLLRRVAKTLDLERNPAFSSPRPAGGQSSWRGVLRAFGLGGAAPRPPAVDDELPPTTPEALSVSHEDLAEAKRLAPYVSALQAGLRVEPVKETRTAGYVKDTRLIDISFRHADPRLAAKVVNTVAQTFVLANLEELTETNTSTGSFLQKRVADLQHQIRADEEQLAKYSREHQIVSLTGDQNIVAERLAGLNRQLLDAENERKMAEAAFRAGTESRAADALAETGGREISDERSRLAELRQKRAQLAFRYTDLYPAVQEIDRQIAEQERQIKESREHVKGVVTTNLETRYRQALAREQSLRAALASQRNETVTQNEAAINYRIIQQSIETNKGLLDGLLQRSRENDVVLAGTPNNISVVDYALAPDSPVGPRRTQSVTLAFLLSLVFGTGLALFLEYLNDTVRSSDDVERMLGLPALSVIPSVGGSPSPARLLTSRFGLERRGRAPVPDAQERPELLLNADPRSTLAEAYRHLRTSVLLSRAEQPPRTLLVTSSLPSEGKTTTSINTALVLAQTGARVCVIDADMRRPSVHRVFGEGNEQGLSTILSSDLGPEEMLAMVRRHEGSGLHLLPSGPVSPNPAELLGSKQMRRLLAALDAGGFTHVVIDSPPIVSFTDGVLISTMVDGVLLVVHGGKTPRNLVRRSKTILRDVGARVLGVVLNNISLQQDDYYYYQHYYGGYDDMKAEAASSRG